MSASAAIIGTKIRAARVATGLSTREAAREVSARGIPISHTTLSKHERGLSLTPVPLLETLAELYGRSLVYLLGEEPTLTGIRYRALKSVRVKDRRHFEGEATRWTRLYLKLEEVLESPLAGSPLQAESDEGGKELAVRLRKKLKYGEMPVPSVIRVLEKQGVRVLQVHSTARIDGISARFGKSPVVALNPNTSNDRFRFNAAHELGHHLFDDGGDDEGSDHDGDDRAHDFASHFLIPDAQVEKAFEGFSMVKLVRFKELFGVSLAAMIYRGKKLGLIPQPLYERIWRDFSRLGWRTKEPGHVQADHSIRLEQLIEEATNDKRMSHGDIAGFASVDASVIRARVLEAIGGREPVLPDPPSPFQFPQGRA